MKKKTFLTFLDFRLQAKKKGLPTSINYWKAREAEGQISFRRTSNKRGSRFFVSVEEIEQMLNDFIGKLK